MNKALVLLLGLGILGIAAFGWFLSTKNKGQLHTFLPTQTPKATPIYEKVDYIGAFAIFTNGTFRVFTAAMYHNLSEDVFVQADNPNIVRVKKSGTTWDDFFKTLPFKLTKECLTTGTKETFCKEFSEYKINKVIYEKQPITIYEART